jgi:two-component system, NarL family, nitrate/nitrite response regulator NarL
METGEQRNGERIQIVVADELPIYGDSLRALLEQQPDFAVVGVAPGGAAAVQMLQERKPDVLLLDVKMTGQDGNCVLNELQTLKIPVRLLLLATSISGPDMMRALQLGAYGVVLRTSPAQRLIDGIRGVMAGQYWIGEEMGSSMKGALQEYSRMKKERGPGGFGLTPRQLEIVSCVVAGYSNSEIAQRHGLSNQTVKHHMTNIFDKLGVFSRLELALFAIHHRLVEEGTCVRK